MGNFVGTNAAGTAAVANKDGLDIVGSNNTIGGTSAGAGNVISGNTGAGVALTGVSMSGASGVVIQGNIIGLAADGSSILGQGGDGISLDSASSGNSIGGTIAGAGNTISGNSGLGIDLVAGAGDTGNLIAGNLVGLDGANDVVGNVKGGMFISGTGNTVGGTAVAARNVISGNQNAGLVVDTGTLVVGNFIGTDSTGNALAGSPQLTGISVSGSSNTIGGTTAGAGNIISGNASQGISISGSTNLIEGNLVGTNAAGTGAVPDGVGVDITGSNNSIGGTTAGAGNFVADNTGTGVVVDTGTGNAVLSNPIFDNTGGGINLVNAGNNNQPAPVLTDAKLVGTQITVDGTLAVKAGTSYLVQYFGNNPASDQGQTLLGSEVVSAQPSDATVPLSFVTSATLPAGATITAIASVTTAPVGSVSPATGDTSAFSAAATVTGINPFVVTNTTDSTTNPQVGSLRFAIQTANADVANDDTIIFEIPTTDPNYDAATGSWTIPLLAGLTIDKPLSGGVQHIVFVDGLSQQSQPGSATTHPVIAIEPGTGFTGTGLTLSSGGNTISGLVVEGFPVDGIDVGAGASGNTIVSNFIGTDVLGASSVGNQVAGVSIASTSNTISVNLISGNMQEGLLISGGANAVLDNLIGTNAAGTGALANGVGLDITGSNNTIGGTAAGASNTIADNTGTGVVVDTGTGNAVLSNPIFDNTTAGITLVNAGNNNQPAPVLTDAKLILSQITVDGTLAVKAGTSYLVQYFGNNPASDQGQTLLGSEVVSAQPSDATVPLSFVTSATLPAGATITAIASVTTAPVGSVSPATGDTSAFSAAATVTGINPFVVTNTTDSTTNPQVGSLRFAIQTANTDVGNDDTITFAIPTTDPNYDAATGSWTIPLLAGLTIDKPLSGGVQHIVFVDGLSQQSQPGSATTHPVIAIEPGTGFTGTGLTLSSGGNTISGLVVEGFPVDGIDVGAGASGNTIVSNFIGTDVLGASSVGNQVAGVSIASTSNTISVNLISGNMQEGLLISGGANAVLDNLIGTNAAGTGALANGVGLDITGSNNTIGGTAAGASNTIADNTGTGVVVDTGTGNAVLSNPIFDNTTAGITLVNAGNNNQPAPVLTDAKLVGSQITVDGTLAVKAGTSYLVQYFGNNPASDQGQTLLGSEVVSAQPSDATVLLSFVTSATLPAGATITAIASVTTAPVGSVSPATGDTSAFSAAATIVGTDPFLVTNTTDSTTNPQVGSLRFAIQAANADVANDDTIIFEIPTTDPNYDAATGSWTIPLLAGLTIDKPLSGGVQHIVFVDGLSQQSQPGSATTHPVIAIEPGTGFTGTGLTLSSGGNTISGLVVEGFPVDGIDVGAGASGNTIVSNFIGTDVLGTSSVGNQVAGVSIASTSNTITQNLISGNAQEGVLISGGANSVLDNLIGTSADGTGALANGNGVDITGSNNTIGGTAAGASNTIADNTGTGVVVDTGTGNAVLSNPIFDNTGSGITLVNAGNNNQPAPVLTDAKLVLSQITVDGTLAVKAGTSYLVQYFGNNPASDQGQTLLGSEVVSAQPSDTTVPLSFVTSATLPPGATITAIASVTTAPVGSVSPATGDTSAFSAAVTVTGVSPFIVTNTTDSITNPQIGSLRFAIQAANADVGNDDTITFAIPTTDPNYDAATGSWTIPLLAGLTIDKPLSGGVQHTVFVDGLSQQSQPGSATNHPVIAIEPGTGFTGTGLTLSSGGNTLSGLVVEGFPVDGIDVSSGASGNTIVSNFIGTDVLGASSVGNQIAGISIASSSNTITENLISGNVQEGLLITGGANSVLDNLIGTSAAGTAALANGVGLDITGSNNSIGGAATGAGNVLSGNTTDGVLLSGASGVVIEGNIIGLAADGSSILGQGGDGISLDSASSGNTIGGTIAGAGNIISGNSGFGIDLVAGAGDTGNLIAGNIVGLDGANDVVGNVKGGMFISGTGNTVGGIAVAVRNVISGNQNAGLAVDTGTLVVGNFIGTDSSGNALAGSPQLTGISVSGSSNTIGGTTAAAGNVISGNASQGISIAGSTNLIEGNFVGTNAAGTGAVPNGVGVDVTGSKNSIGGTAGGAGNTIADNTGTGVVVDTGTGNAVLSNSIHDNTAGGIKLVNVGNNNQPAPVLTGATIVLTQIIVDGTLAVKAGTSYLVQYFGNNPASDQGQTLLGSEVVSAQPSDATVPLSFVTSATLPPGATITAIASVTTAPVGSVSPATGDTSAFSPAATVTGISPFVVTNTTDSITNPQIGSLRFAIQTANADVANNDTITFAIPTTDPNYDAATGSWTIPLLAGLTIDKPLSGGVQHTVFVDGLSQQSQPGSATSHPVIAIEPGAGFTGTGLTLSSGGNTISGLVVEGFPVDGIDVGAGASGNTIVSNFIGTDVLGASSAGNQGAGISIASSSNTISENLISGNVQEGMLITGGANSVLDNRIGTSADGTAAVANGNGVDITGSNNSIGGAASGAGNVLSGNTTDGVLLSGASGVLIEGNIIGLAANGSSILGQGGDGISLEEASSGNTIGGTIAGAGNIISGNSGFGIDLVAGAGDTGNLIAGNIVGLDGSNNVAGNVEAGILISGTGNTVGGTAVAARNVISGNQNAGLVIDTGTLVVGNFIGTDSSGNALAAGKQLTGIIVGGSSNTIGGTTATARNVISSNATEGISITGSTNLIEGNFVGTNAAGTGAAPNGDGVDITGSNNTIGGTSAGAGNTIADNTGTGVVVVTGTGNAVLSNSIHDNTAGGIKLANGGNNNQTAPVLTDANLVGNQITVDGTLAVKAGTRYLVQYFGNNPASDQGQTLLGSEVISPQPSDATAPLSFVTSAALPPGATITAIASVTTAPVESVSPATGDTSAFSAAATVVGIDPFIVTNTTDSTTNPQVGSLRFAIQTANADVGNDDTITFAIPTTDPNYDAATGSWTIPLLAGLTIDKPLSGGVQHIVFVDGLSQQSQPGSATTHPVIAIEPGSGFTGTGLTLSSGGNTVVGLVVEGFPVDGIDVSSGASGNTIVSNFIGTDVLGASSAGNQIAGISIASSSNTISENLISGNAQEGMLITGGANSVFDNRIGTNADGTAAVANGVGVDITGSNNTIGGTTAEAGNTIADNTGTGVVVDTGTGNAVLSNSIFDNTAGGILLVNAGNNNQLAPVLTDAKLGMNQITVDGTLAVKAGTSYLVQYFGNNPASDQGQTLLGSQVVTQQPSDGTVPLSFVTAAALPTGATITAIASVTTAPPESVSPATGDTSAFSAAATIVGIDPFIVTNTTDSTTNPQFGSLRFALQAANADAANNDTITFQIPTTDPNYDAATGSWKIHLLAGLTIDKPSSGGVQHIVVVDGLSQQSQPGSATTHPVIAIEPGSGFTGTGLTLSSGGNTVVGLVVEGFPVDGIDVSSGASGNTIVSNYIGTDVLGASSVGNQGAGISIASSSNTISGNLISGNAQEGVLITGGANSVLDNRIGTDAAGTAAVANGIGVDIAGSNNTIGGAGVGAGNVVSGNAGAGVFITNAVGPAVSNSILGNLIGTDLTGMQPLGNLGGGVVVTNSSGNVIGGTAAGARNVISANAVAGIQISGQLSSQNQVAGNYIGTNIDGTDRPGSPDIPTPQPNLLPVQPTGVLLVGVSGNTVGGAGFQDASSNLISGNIFGIQILGNPSANTQAAPAIGANAILGNKIGTDPTGLQAVPNFEIGIFVVNSASNAISGNLISGNGIAGIDIFGTGSTNNSVSSNLIGSNAQGQASFRKTSSTTSFISPTTGILVFYGLQEQGVVVIGASNNQIGSTGGNQLVGNVETGIFIANLDSAGTRYPAPVHTKIQNNSIRSNGIYGVLLYNSPNNPISTKGATRNLFSGNPVKIRDFRSAVDSKKPQPPPRSKHLKLPSGPSRTSSHPKHQAKGKHLVVSHRHRVPALFSKDSSSKPVSHKPSEPQLRLN